MTATPRLLSLLPLVLLLLSGCAATVARESGEAALHERARLYWAAREAGDAIKSYEFESASVTGEQSLQAYVQRQSLMIRKAEVRGVEIGEDGRGKVRVAVEYVLPMAGFSGLPQKGEFDDGWLLLEGRWYHEWRPPYKPGSPR